MVFMLSGEILWIVKIGVIVLNFRSIVINND